jgi:hypothetical protein
MSQAIPGFTPQMPSYPYQGNSQQQISAALASSSSDMQGDSIAPVAIGVTAGGLLTAVAVTLAVKHFSASGDKPKPSQATSLSSKPLKREESAQIGSTQESTEETPLSQSAPRSQSVPLSQSAPRSQSVPPSHQPTWQSQPLPPPPRQPTAPPQFPFMRLPPELRGQIASFLPDGTLRVNHALDDEFRPDMQKLRIRNSQDLDTVIKQFPNVKKLDLSEFNDLSDADCEQISKLTNLQRLDISGCNAVSDAGFEHFKALTKLQVLHIDWFLRVSDAGLEHLKPLTNLQVLSIRSCPRVTGAGLTHLKPLTKLYINWCRGVTDEIFERLKAFPNLQLLEIYGWTNVTDAGVSEFRRERPQCKVIGR